MSRYIDVDDIKIGMSLYGFSSPDQTITEFVEDILPTADVQPVVRGEWTELYEDNYKCSACGTWWTLHKGTSQDNGMNFCPECGARMVEE